MFRKLITPQHQFILIVAFFLMATGNAEFFHHLIQAYPFTDHPLFLASITAFFIFATALLLNLICYGRFTAWILAVMVVLASSAAYFIDHYGVVIDINMLDNVSQTNMKEAA